MGEVHNFRRGNTDFRVTIQSLTATQLGCRTLEDMLATSDSIKRIFDSTFKPIGILEADVGNSRTLRYHLLWEAWRSVTVSTEVSTSNGPNS